ncbi:MAG: 50S ribosomal protein L6 [Candidatus Pacebacteria bacterium]|nr:50S ribosomal protein L6 [Candidatus Paceibacterota bacterium]
MSRIGKRAIVIPAKTEVSVADGVLTVKGPKGTLTKGIHPFVSIEAGDKEVLVSPKNETRLAKALWGTYASHLKNMQKGVNEEFKKKLVLDGIGFRMAVSGKSLTLNIGFSHPVVMDIPEGITALVEKNELTLTGIDKELVGQFSANVRAKKKPEPYKGKGFHYSDEIVIRKQGKKAS